MIHNIEDKTQKELVEIVKIQMEEYEKLLKAEKQTEAMLCEALDALKAAERERDDYKRIAVDAATESFLIAADNEIKRALAQDNKSASAINHCQQQFHRAARSRAIDCVNNQLRQQLNGNNQ